MEVINDSNTKSNNQLVVIMHLSQLLNLVSGLGGIIVPLVIWLSQRERDTAIDDHGKQILNFQITMFIAAIVAIPCIFLFGLGILMLIGIGLLTLIIPIIGGIKASNNEFFEYPFTLQFIK
ncbi:DUF4870 domain-containing protein [Gilvibacter sp.]|uniref:DUF4870 domain-containing protein n=1 Tax=Gilvibacter sp. TaxID=2729997 RepID=UPI0025BDB9AE|nr:DUF4870 domain-containing protein [Gilvibacter sp.]NQX77666.1 DUF4870 domain-containing protein [Gilvibacter sp.]